MLKYCTLASPSLFFADALIAPLVLHKDHHYQCVTNLGMEAFVPLLYCSHVKKFAPSAHLRPWKPRQTSAPPGQTGFAVMSADGASSSFVRRFSHASRLFCGGRVPPADQARLIGDVKRSRRSNEPVTNGRVFVCVRASRL